MRKLFVILWLCIGVAGPAAAQVNWKEGAGSFADIAWDNYSTSYMGEGSDSIPLIVAAIPYNGIYDHGDGAAGNTRVDLSFSGSAYRFRSQLSNQLLRLTTYDSGAVYFLAPGIFPSNAGLYEFRVLEDDSTVIRPWGPVTAFTDPSFGLHAFRPAFGFLGGYSTTWKHYLVVELRRKGATAPLSVSMVYWQPTRPVLQAVFTPGELTTRMLSLTNDYRVEDSPPGSGKGVPDHWEVAPEQEGLIFQVRARVYRKNVVEYRLLRKGTAITGWTGNKANNSYIWIDNPGPADYVLEMRYRKQRHNVTAYPFTIRPAWYQTWTFRILAVTAVLVLIGFGVVLFKLRRQQRKTATEQAKKERFEQGLKSVYAQLNPHFTFNALSSIQGLINNNDIQGANRYLSDFASLVRRSLADSEQATIPLQRELQTLDTYLTLERLRFNFTYIIHWEEGLPVAAIEIPSLLLQPLAENAVKHGVATLQEQGLIRVEVISRQQDMLIRVSDNGQGFEPGRETPGYGLKLTKDRIRLLNEMAGQQQVLLTIQSAPGKGTVIEFLFKNWLA